MQSGEQRLFEIRNYMNDEIGPRALNLSAVNRRRALTFVPLILVIAICTVLALTLHSSGLIVAVYIVEYSAIGLFVVLLRKSPYVTVPARKAVVLKHDPPRQPKFGLAKIAALTVGVFGVVGAIAAVLQLFKS